MGEAVAFDDQEVLFVYGPDRIDEAAVEGDEVCLAAGVRLVDEIVTGDGGFAGIAFGDLVPEAGGPGFVGFAFEQSGVFRVGDEQAGLAAGAGVHIENGVDVIVFAPTDHGVEEGEVEFRVRLVMVGDAVSRWESFRRIYC